MKKCAFIGMIFFSALSFRIGLVEPFVPGDGFKKMMAEEYGMVRQFMKTSSAEGQQLTKGDRNEDEADLR